MHYWNKDNFEGLTLVSAALRDDPQLAGVSRYCTLRVKGLRKQALTEIRDLTSAALQWSIQTRRSAVDRLLRVWCAHPEVHQLLPQPLIHDLVLPTLEEWAGAEPESAAAQRWLGMITGERARLETALVLDPADDIARSRLVAGLLGDVEYASHHLVEGRFIGKESDADEALRGAENLLASARDRAKFVRLDNWLSQLRSLLNDWSEYRQAPDGEFREWCAMRGCKHEWPVIVYWHDGAG